MSFRYLKWGNYPDQFASFLGRQIASTSVVLYGSSPDTDLPSECKATGSYQDEMWLKAGTVVYTWSQLIKIDMTNLRAMLGQAPIILSAELAFWQEGGGTTQTVQARRILLDPGWTDATGRYRVGPAVTTWTHDVYGPVYGEDVRNAPFFDEEITWPANVWNDNCKIDLGTELPYVLRANQDLKFLLELKRKDGSNYSVRLYWDKAAYMPYFEIRYLNSVEFFSANDDGTINLEHIAIESEDLADSLYLGELQRGDVGTAVKAYAKNLGETTFALVEIWDDFPEVTVPTHSEGSGTGNLDYVEVTESAVSQRYTVDFYSPTEYEIKAEAFRDNTVGLHPQIDSNGDWQGTTLTDFTAPSGGLSIPAKCWQPDGLTAADTFEVLVLGNTTDLAWPDDSNDQVEITHDNAGSPDTTAWRPVDGRRTRLRVACDVDATTKKFYVLPITASHWPIGDPCWVGDADAIDEGSIKTVAEASIGADTQTGSGLDDINVVGNYIGTDEDSLYIECDGTGTPDTFKWGRGASYPPAWTATGVSMVAGSANAILLGTDGPKVYWDASTGHTSGDYWTVSLTPFSIEVESLTSGANSYAVGAKVGTTLPTRDVAPSVWDVTNAASGASEAQPHRIYIDDPGTAGFTVGSTVTISNADATVHNTRVIAGGGVTSTYIELTANLTDDFASGAFVIQAGEGQVPFWLKVTATLSTVEELKQLRLNVRT